MEINKDNDSQCLRNVQVGENVKIHGFVNAYSCSIGDDSKVGTFVEIQKGASIGRNCKISSHSFICEGVKIEDNVFIGHGVMFTNDKFPRATNSNGALQTEADWSCLETVVESGASIGSGATILCGLRIGKGSLVGAGAVVTRDIPPHAVAVGNPARVIRYINESGENQNAQTDSSSGEYETQNGRQATR